MLASITLRDQIKIFKINKTNLKPKIKIETKKALLSGVT
jgi:hypothetical protein